MKIGKMERLVDNVGLGGVLELLVEVCYLKADLDHTWQHSASDAWNRRARLLARLLARLE